ncbi:MAG: peptidoglycan-binding protein [Butyrivibrio sp.]
MNKLRIMQENVDEGSLRVDITDERGQPVEGAVADISYTGAPESILEELTTNSNGQTPTIRLPAPPLEYSSEPGVEQPFSEYNIVIRKAGFAPFSVSGAELFSGQTSIQNIRLTPSVINNEGTVIVIGPNTLFGNYPPKIPESEIKPMDMSGEIVLDRVIVPEVIVVHDGSPRDSTANNYTVRFTDYIKNVACSEIYPTWPTETLIANVIAIVSFTLNRVYTEWYRNKGYDFTITSSTAFDHKWTRGRTFFEDISSVVDEVFADYVSRPDIKQPLLTQYCDGKRTTCSGMSQWGSKALGDDNYSALQILRTYYGSNIYINTAEEVAGIPLSFPGEVLTIGSAGRAVRTIQEQLVSIRNTYGNIPRLSIDGIYGEQTAAAVEAFQRIFDLPVTGAVNYPTWYKISQLYVALERLAEL